MPTAKRWSRKQQVVVPEPEDEEFEIRSHIRFERWILVAAQVKIDIAERTESERIKFLTEYLCPPTPRRAA